MARRRDVRRAGRGPGRRWSPRSCPRIRSRRPSGGPGRSSTCGSAATTTRPDEVAAWAARLEPFLAVGEDAYVFFRHDPVGRGPELALELVALVAAADEAAAGAGADRRSAAVALGRAEERQGARGARRCRGSGAGRGPRRRRASPVVTSRTSSPTVTRPRPRDDVVELVLRVRRLRVGRARPRGRTGPAEGPGRAGTPRRAGPPRLASLDVVRVPRRPCQPSFVIGRGGVRGRARSRPATRPRRGRGHPRRRTRAPAVRCRRRRGAPVAGRGRA